LPFDKNTECDYYFHAPNGQDSTFMISFEDIFELDGGDCAEDEISIAIDGEYNSYQSSYKWYSLCGLEAPKMIAIPGPDLEIIFHSSRIV
jgi:hypothetical protein